MYGTEQVAIRFLQNYKMLKKKKMIHILFCIALLMDQYLMVNDTSNYLVFEYSSGYSRRVAEMTLSLALVLWYQIRSVVDLCT